MKKNYCYLLFLLFMFSCSKENQKKPVVSEVRSKNKTISLSEAIGLARSSTNMMKASATKTSTYNLQELPLGCMPSTTTVSGARFIRTHGSVSTFEGETANGKVKYLYLSTSNLSSAKGSEFAIAYPFKYGTTYTIKVAVRQYAIKVTGSPEESLKRRPSLKAQMTNFVLPNLSDCNSNEDLVPLSGPSQILTFGQSPSNTVGNNQVVTFSPDQCYNYVQFSSVPNMTGESIGNVEIAAIEITETNSISIDGPTSLPINEEANYTVGYNGLPISSSFDWKVKGDLQIIGATTGPSVRVKTIGANGGTISIGLNGCESMAEFVIPTTSQYCTMTGAGQVVGGTDVPGGYEYHLSGPLENKPVTDVVWTTPPGWNIVDEGERSISILPRRGESQAGFVRVTLKIDGISYTAQSYVKAVWKN